MRNFSINDKKGLITLIALIATELLLSIGILTMLYLNAEIEFSCNQEQKKEYSSIY